MVSQFEDLLIVLNTLGMLHRGLCLCGGRVEGFASVMSAVGDYTMLINAHAPSIPPLFEL